MAKRKTKFMCRDCGYESPKWMGRCPGCGEWNTMDEEVEIVSKGPRGAFQHTETIQQKAMPISAIATDRGAEGQNGARRIEPGARRRNRPGFAHADRRGSGHRKIDVAAASVFTSCESKATCPLHIRRGIDKADEVASRTSRCCVG